MIKNQLYPYIEKYFNELLYGFTKEQFEVGVMNGQIKLEKLNFRPDGTNKILDDKNFSFWLKAGFITKIYIGCSIMNFIGEKPLDVEIDGVDIILTPSYKWIIKNLDSFITENGKQMREPYDPNDNNSMDIFERKVNVIDNSIFKNELILEIFKDGTKISQMINVLYKYCYKFYYMKNFLVHAKIRNVHIRLEDDQLINFNGNIAIGIKIDSLDITLNSEGVMKKDSFKVNNLNIYWESNAKILIPSDLLNNSIINGELNQKYYDNLKKLNFQHFNYIEGTKFIVQNFNCNGKLGTISVSSGKIDLFGKRDNLFKMYCQFSSNELNINFFPELFSIYSNYRKFIQEFNVLEQVQDFKPMRKPYNNKNAEFKDMLKKIKENQNSMLSKIFPYKRKMIVRDWIYYFYWCQKCKETIYGRCINPLKLEFSRFYGLCFNQWDDFSESELKKKNEKAEENKNKEELNPDNVILSLIGDFLIKGININFHYGIKQNDKEYISIIIGGVDFKLNSSQNKFDISTNIKYINLCPNKIIIGESYIINSNIKRKKEFNVIKGDNKTINNEPNKFMPLYDIEENTGLVGLVKKYNPNYDQKIKIIDNALDKISTKSRMESRAVSEIDPSEFSPKFSSFKYQNHNNNINNNFKNNNNFNNNGNLRIELNSTNKFLNDRQRSPLSIKYNNYNYNMPKNNSFAKQIISNYEPTPMIQRMELKKQKNEFSISKAINEYNSIKSRERASIRYTKNPSSQIQGIIYSKNQNLKSNGTEVVPMGKTVPLNLMEISTNNNSSKCFIFKYTKNNNNNLIDNLFIEFGTIRFNIFMDYVSSYLNVFSKYKSIINKPIINSLNKIDNGIKLQKELFKMKKYIFNYIMKNPPKEKNDQLKEYVSYLKKELDKAKFLGAETDHFEINYLMSFFPIGFDVSFDYESIECLYYNNEKKISGKGVIPPSEFQFIISPNIIKIKFFDFEFEINDLENAKFLLSKIYNIFEEKLKMTKLFIEPCIAQMREDLNKHNNNNKKNELDKKNKQLENMLLLVQEKYKKKTKSQNEEDIVNYKNLVESKDKNQYNIMKDYKINNYIQTLNENGEEDINDVDNEEMNKIGKIKFNETKKPNNLYSNIFEDYRENSKKEDFEFQSKFNSSEHKQNQNVFMKKISPKNNLPKVNKK